MFAHKRHSANWFDKKQVPNDTLRSHAVFGLTSSMTREFREALLWHMSRHNTSITELSTATGVSRDVINKLRGRAGSSTTVENGIKIAAFYGKDVSQFIRCEDVDAGQKVSNLLALLSPSEQQLLEAQIDGLVRRAATEEPSTR